MYKVYLSYLNSSVKSFTGKYFRTYREAQDYANELNRNLTDATAIVLMV